jgi:hypothetical protein
LLHRGRFVAHIQQSRAHGSAVGQGVVTPKQHHGRGFVVIVVVAALLATSTIAATTTIAIRTTPHVHVPERFREWPSHSLQINNTGRQVFTGRFDGWIECFGNVAAQKVLQGFGFDLLLLIHLALLVVHALTFTFTIIMLIMFVMLLKVPGPVRTDSGMKARVLLRHAPILPELLKISGRQGRSRQRHEKSNNGGILGRHYLDLNEESIHWIWDFDHIDLFVSIRVKATQA